jgi:hypothetical protein
LAEEGSGGFASGDVEGENEIAGHRVVKPLMDTYGH